MGRALGEASRAEIGEFYGLRLQNAIDQARMYGRRLVDESELLSIAKKCVAVVQASYPEGYQELAGIAEGSALTVEQVWAMNNLTDLRDVGAFGGSLDLEEGCSSAMFFTASNKMVAGQTWDLATDNMPFVCMVRRKPSFGKQTISLSTVGCLTLIGMNETGLSVGTTNLRTTDVRVGVGYLDVLHAAVQADDLEAAKAVVETSPRAGGHYYWLVDEHAGYAISASAERAVARKVEGLHVQCNHVLEQAIQGLEVKNTPVASSHQRQERLTELLQTMPRSTQTLRAALSDTEHGENAIVRRDYGGVSTNAAVVLSPSEKTLWAVHGPPLSNEGWMHCTFDR